MNLVFPGRKHGYILRNRFQKIICRFPSYKIVQVQESMHG